MKSEGSPLRSFLARSHGPLRHKNDVTHYIFFYSLNLNNWCWVFVVSIQIFFYIFFLIFTEGFVFVIAPVLLS